MTKINIKNNYEDKIFNFVIWTLGILIFIVVMFPLVYVVSASFSSPLAVVSGEVWVLPKGINLEAYKGVFKNKDILLGYKNTIIYTLLGTFINIAMTTAIAYPLSRKDLMGRNIITMFLTFTMFFGGGMIPTYLLIKNLNMLDTIWALVIPGAVSMWNMLILKNYFQSSIPEEIIEAAIVDGCTNVGALIRIVLPLSKSILAVMTIFYVVGHWNAYFDSLIYIRNQKMFPLQLILRQILLNSQTLSTGEASTGNTAEQQLLFETLKFALIVVSSVPVLVLYPFLQKYFVTGVFSGSIKG